MIWLIWALIAVLVVLCIKAAVTIYRKNTRTREGDGE
ncbi:MAG: hypothetical protein DDT20_01804 [Firmicutes bacterium]|nr:hypothetical protein [Bacillota bacterium]